MKQAFRKLNNSLKASRVMTNLKCTINDLFWHDVTRVLTFFLSSPSVFNA